MKEGPKESLRGFLKLCCEAGSAEALYQLFGLFFTLEEKEMLASRYLIVQALVEGKLTQREIAEKYHTSISQITRGSNALKIIDKNCEKLLIHHFRSQKKR